MATTTRKKAADKTVADWEEEAKRLEAALANAKSQIATSKVKDALDTTKLLDEWKLVKEKAKNVSDMELLLALGNALGIKRLQVTQAPPAKRAATSKKKTEEKPAAKK